MKWFLNMRTRSKIIASLGALLALLFIVVTIAYVNLSAASLSQRELFVGDYLATVSFVELRSTQNRARADVLELLQTKDKGRQKILEADIEAAASNIDQALEAVRPMSEKDSYLSGKLAELQALRVEYQKTRDQQIALIHEGKTEEALALSLGVQDDRYNKIREITLDLEKRAKGDASLKVEQVDRNTASSNVLFLVIGAVALLLGLVTTIVLDSALVKPLVEITRIAETIARGDLSVEISPNGRKDEVGVLSRTFGEMTAYIKEMATIATLVAEGDLTAKAMAKSDKDVMGKALAAMLIGLRGIATEIIEGVAVLASSSSEIMASTSQVVAAAAETAASVSETTATVEEVKQVVKLTNDKSRDVTEASRRAVQTAQDGRAAVQGSIEGMTRIQQQVQAIAESIVRLSEQSQAIGEIIATVNDLAEQSKLLAVNAAIEAARAGEQGKGFAVVAQEVKSLAEQSKSATTQVRAILSDIQKATNAAVMATEQGSQAVEAGVAQSKEAGEAIRQMGECINSSAQAGMQIAASSQELLTGMGQVALAMESIREASAQNVGGMRQVEATVQGLHDLGQKLQLLAGRYKV